MLTIKKVACTGAGKPSPSILHDRNVEGRRSVLMPCGTRGAALRELWMVHVYSAVKFYSPTAIFWHKKELLVRSACSKRYSWCDIKLN